MIRNVISRENDSDDTCTSRPQTIGSVQLREPTLALHKNSYTLVHNTTAHTTIEMMNPTAPSKAPKPMSISSPPPLMAAAMKVKTSGVPLPNARSVAPATSGEKFRISHIVARVGLLR
eukprot:178984_1